MSLSSSDCRLSLDEVPFCALDLETTQVPGSPGALAITEIGAQKFRGHDLVDVPFETLVNPGCPIRPFDTQVSGIGDAMVAGKPTFRDVIDQFISYVEGHVIVAHNAKFDRRALESQGARDGLALPEMLFVDTASLLRKTVALRSYSLEAACRHFGIDVSGAHRAGTDCMMVVKLFWAVRPELEAVHHIRYLGDLLRLLGLRATAKPVQDELF